MKIPLEVVDEYEAMVENVGNKAKEFAEALLKVRDLMVKIAETKIQTISRDTGEH